MNQDIVKVQASKIVAPLARQTGGIVHCMVYTKAPMAFQLLFTSSSRPSSWIPKYHVALYDAVSLIPRVLCGAS